MASIGWTFPWPTPPPKELRRKGRSYSISLNHMYVWTGRGGQRRLSAFAEGWKHDQIDRVLRSGLALPAGPLALELAIHPPDAIQRDADGLIKLAEDAVFEAYRLAGLSKAVANDYRVVDIHVHRHAPDRRNPRLELRLRTWRAVTGQLGLATLDAVSA